MSFLLCTVARLVLGRYLIKNAHSPFLMPALQETAVEVAHSCYKISEFCHRGRKNKSSEFRCRGRKNSVTVVGRMSHQNSAAVVGRLSRQNSGTAVGSLSRPNSGTTGIPAEYHP